MKSNLKQPLQASFAGLFATLVGVFLLSAFRPLHIPNGHILDARVASQTETPTVCASILGSTQTPGPLCESPGTLHPIDDDSGHEDDDIVDIGAACDPGLTFSSLEELEAASGSMSPHCAQIATLGVLSKLLDDTVARYTSIDNGYDHKFEYYIKWVKEDMIPGAIDNYVGIGTPGIAKFNCRQKSWRDSDRDLGSCRNVYHEMVMDGSYDMTMTLQPQDEQTFWTELGEQHGVDKAWVKFGDRDFSSKPCVRIPGSPREPGVDNCPDVGKRVWHGWPVEADNVQVPNPKDVLAQTLPNVAALQLEMQVTLAELVLGEFGGSSDDAVQTFAMPVLMLMQAVDSMEQVKEIGEKVEAAEKRDLILLIVSAVLFAIPFIGEVAGALGASAQLVRIAVMMGELGNAAVAIHEVVGDPMSAPLQLFGLLFAGVGAGGSRLDAAAFKKAGDLRRGVQPGTVAKLGELFRKYDGTIQRICKTCLK